MIYDVYGRTDASRIYLAKPGKALLGCLNGADADSCNLTLNLINSHELTFDVYKYYDGELTNYYDYIDILMELYVDGFGWYVINESPSTHNDGIKEYKTVSAKSYESTLSQYDLVGFDVNTASPTSREMLATDNVYTYSESSDVWYNLFHDRVLFYRDTSQHKDLLDNINTLISYTDLQQSLSNYPEVIYNDWRITVLIDEKLRSGFSTMKNKASSEGERTLWQDCIDNYDNSTGVTSDSVKLLLLSYPELIKYINVEFNKHKYTYDSDVGRYNETEEEYSAYELMELEYKRIKELSLLDLILSVSGVPGWTIGTVDKELYLEHVDMNGVAIRLQDEVGSFEIDSQDVYSFLVNDLSGYFDCVFTFDTVDNKINALRIETLGIDTKIFLGFRNVENSIDITPAQDLFTQLTVENSEGLTITDVNFGEREIDDISYFLNTKYLSQELIDKYNNWKEYRDQQRDAYVQLSRDYNEQNKVVTEIKTRVPSDMLNISQLNSYTSYDQLEEIIDNYYALMIGMLNSFIYVSTEDIEHPGDVSTYDEYSEYIDAMNHYIDQLYDLVDVNKESSATAFEDSLYYKDYIMMRDFTIPNLVITHNNLSLPSYETKQEYIDSYEYDFDTYGDMYGLDELKHYQQRHLDSMSVKQDYAVAWEDIPDTEEGNAYKSKYLESDYKRHHDLYVKYKNGYDSATREIAERQAEYDNAMSSLESISIERSNLSESVKISNYMVDGNKYFTDDEISRISRLLRHTDYVNDNISYLNNIDTTSTLIDKQLKMYKEAMDELYAESHPQYMYSTSVDNLLANNEYELYHPEFNVGNFIRLGLDDETQVKLRITMIQFNPMTYDNNLQLTFSNMVRYWNRRNDFQSLLNSAITSAKNSITARYSRSADADSTVQVTYDLVQKILQSSQFTAMSQNIQSGSVNAATGAFQTLASGYIKTDELSARIAEIDELNADSAFMKYLEANLIVASEIDVDKLVTDLITGKDGNSNYYMDLLTGHLNMNTITTNIIQGQDSQGNYYIDLISGEIAIDKLVSSDGKTAVEFVNGAVSTDTIATNLITGKDGDAGYYMNLLTGHLNMNTIVGNNVFTNAVTSISSATATSVIDDAYIYNAVANKITVADLAAGDIVLSNQMRILSENDATEGMVMTGSEIQFLDENGNPSISIGYNTISDGQGGTTVDYSHPAIIIKDENGSILLNSKGLSQTDVGIAPMIQSHSVDEGKLSFDFIKTANGDIIVQNYDGSTSTWGRAITEFVNTIDGKLETPHPIDVDVMYAVSSSNVIAPLSNWDTNAPSYTLDVYVWERAVTTYENNSTSATTPVCIQPTGEQYDSIAEQYYKSTSSSTQIEGSWTTTKPTWESGYYIWTRSVINWTGGDITYSTPVLATPDQSIYTSTINTINDIATQDSQGRWSLTEGVMSNTYVYTDEEHTNPISLSMLGSNITATTEGIIASVEKNVVDLINTESDKRKALYGTCLTEADTAIKEVICDNFELYTGATISVEFKYQNTQERPKLNVEGTGDYLIKSYKNEELSEEEYSWDAGSVLDFVFDGRRWRMLDNGAIKKIFTAESRIDMNADKIRAMVTVDGQTSSITLTQNMLEAITDQFVVKSPNGSETIISGGLLSTNAIKSNNYVDPPDGPNPYSITGTFLNLANGNIHSPNFAVDNVNKHAYLNGTIHTKAGEIGGFTITENSIYNNMTSLDDEVSDEDIPLGEGVYLEAQDYYVLDEDDYLTTNFRPVLYGVYIGTDGIALGKGKFKVDAFGNMYANSATIVGNITANSLMINESANVSGLIKAINSSTDSDGGSLVKISADKIQFEGATYFDSFSKKTETVSDVVVEYAKSTSASEFIAVSGSDGEWSPTAPDWSANTYMWQRTGKTINGNTTYTYTCIQGAKGDSGGEGGSVTITSIKYAVTSTESQPADSAFTYTTVPTVPEGSWLWCLTTYSSGNKSYSKSKQGKSPVVSKSGDTVTITGADGESVTVSDGSSPIVTKSGDTVTITDGEGNTVTVKDGEKGDSVKGDDGKPAYFHIAWANSADGATDFSTTVSTNKLYMGTYTDENETDSSNYRDYKWVKVKGDQGKSLTQVTEYYARNNSTTAPADSAFGTSVLTPTANERYVWNYEVLSWNDNGETSTSKTNKHIVAVFGESGNDGKSLVSVTEYYTVNNVATNTPSYESFDTTVVSPTAENRYLWNYELLTWNDNGTTSTERTPRHIAGVYGDRGTSVTNVTSTNNTEDGGFSVITITLSDGSTKTFQVKNGNRGPKGEPGVIAQWYYGTLLEHKTGTATLVASATEGAVVGSMYLNTDTSDIYQCTEVGNPDNTWIYAGNLASGLLDSIEIGGTNILRQLPKQYSSAAYNAYQLYLSENLVANQTYTIQFWNVDVSHSDKGAADLGLSVYWGGGSINLVTMNGTDYFTDGHADYLVATFTVTESQANNTSGGSANNWLNIYNSVPSASGTMSMSIERWKLEKGNIATDWSPVPGDLIGKVQQIYCRTNSTSLPSKPTSIVTRSDEVNTSNNSSPNWTIRRMPMIDVNNVNYRYCYTCSQWISIDGVFLGASDVVQDEAHTVIDGGNIITNTVTAAQINFADATGNTLKLQNPDTSAHFLIDGDTLQAYNSSNQLYFEVSNTGIKYGASLGTTVATTGDVSNAQTAAAIDATNKADSAAWSVSISVNSINYTANTAVLKATVYKYGVEQSSGFGVQWYKNGTAISGATSLTSPEVSADATYTCIVT